MIKKGKKEKRQVGRPKLADTKLKKKSLIMLGICLALVLTLLFTGARKLNIIKFGKLKGKINYDSYNIGDEYCIESECFYVIKNDENEFKALAKYNLNLETNMQDANSKGYLGTGDYEENNDPINDTVAYKYELFDHLKAYSEIIGVEDVLLLTVEDAEGLGCDLDNSTCADAPNWVYQTSYWLLAPDDYQSPGIFYNGGSSHYEFEVYRSNYGSLGVRPVITIEKRSPAEREGAVDLTDELSYENSCTEFSAKDEYSLGDEIALCNKCSNKSEDFYVLSDNGDSVTVLSKYNLLIGNILKIDYDEGEIVSNDVISSSTKDYGLQCPGALGFSDGGTEDTIIGGVPFTNVFDYPNYSQAYWSTDTVPENPPYWGSDYLRNEYGGPRYPGYVYDNNSNLYKIIGNYRNYLSDTLGYNTSDGYPISYEQLEELGAEDDTITENVPSWISTTSYWTGTAVSGGSVKTVFRDGFITTFDYVSPIIGVRPVIEISKDELRKEPRKAKCGDSTDDTSKNSGNSSTKKDNKTTISNSNDNKTTIKENKLNTTSISTTKKAKNKVQNSNTDKVTLNEEQSKVLSKVLPKIERPVTKKETTKKCNWWWLLLLLIPLGYIIYKINKTKKY